MRRSALVLVIWSVAAGCWSVGDADRSKLLEMVPGLFEQATGAKAERVDCPDAKDKSKKVLDCVVTASGMDLRVRVLVGSDAPGMPEGQNINVEVIDKMVYGRNQEAGIREAFGKKGLTLDSLTCPPLTKVATLPAELDCSGSAQGVTIEIRARVFEDDSKYKVTKGAVDVDSVAEQLQAVATSRGVPGKVTCEKSIHVLVPNSSFHCTGGDLKLRFSVDAAGKMLPEPEPVP